jgi:hypothetical protein
MWSVLEKVPWAAEKDVYYTVAGYTVFFEGCILYCCRLYCFL